MANNNYNYDCDSDVPTLPINLAGLSITLSAHNKFYIYDLLNVVSSSPYEGIFYYKTRPVCRVDIMGIIVRIEKKEAYSMFVVDDGTAFISCYAWKKENDKLPANLVQNITEKLGNTRLGELALKACALKTAAESGSYERGSLVNIRGRLRQYNDIRQINIKSLRLVDDPNEEVKFMLEKLQLYQNAYDKPLRLPGIPSHSYSELDCCNTNEKILQNIAYGDYTLYRQLEEYVVNLSDTSRLTVLDFCDILASLEPNKRSREEYVRLADIYVHWLVHGGYVLPSLSEPTVYTSLSRKSVVDQVIVDILKQQQLNYDNEMGLSTQTILDGVQQCRNYSQLNTLGLITCLNRLLSASVIISTKPDYYKLL